MGIMRHKLTEIKIQVAHFAVRDRKYNTHEISNMHLYNYENKDNFCKIPVISEIPKYTFLDLLWISVSFSSDQF